MVYGRDLVGNFNTIGKFMVSVDYGICSFGTAGVFDFSEELGTVSDEM